MIMPYKIKKAKRSAYMLLGAMCAFFVLAGSAITIMASGANNDYG